MCTWETLDSIFYSVWNKNYFTRSSTWLCLLGVFRVPHHYLTYLLTCRDFLSFPWFLGIRHIFFVSVHLNDTRRSCLYYLFPTTVPGLLREQDPTIVTEIFSRKRKESDYDTLWTYLSPQGPPRPPRPPSAPSLSLLRDRSPVHEAGSKKDGDWTNSRIETRSYQIQVGARDVKECMHYDPYRREWRDTGSDEETIYKYYYQEGTIVTKLLIFNQGYTLRQSSSDPDIISDMYSIDTCLSTSVKCVLC